MKKAIFITSLVLVAMSSSIFMVYESSKFYAIHYTNNWQGIWLAAMLEVFVMLLAMVKIGGFWRQVGQKLLMSIIFCIIIFSAGLYASSGTFTSFASAKQTEELKTLLGTEIEELKNELNVFKDQNQKGNTAKTAIRRDKAIQEMKDLLKQKAVTNKGQLALVYVFLLFIIRIAVQTANIYCAWMIGFIYRQGNYFTTGLPLKPKGKAPACPCGCGQPVEWSERKNEWNKAIDGHQFRKKAVEAFKKAKAKAD